MAEFTDIDRQMLQETHETVIEHKILMIGVIDKINGLIINHKTLEKEHNKLNKSFWILVGFLVGTGVLGTGIWGLLH